MTSRQALIGLGLAVLAVVAGGIGGFLSRAYLEIWFDPVEGFKIVDFSTWPKLADGLRASFDVTKPEVYRAYYGENAGNGETQISAADMVLRNFEMSGRLVGLKRKTVNGKSFVYSITGYSNSERMVLTQRGPRGGIGDFFLEKTQDADNNIYYFGYFLTEDLEPGATQKTLTQCPFVMMDKELAEKSYTTTSQATTKIDILKYKCTPYQFPRWTIAKS